MAPQVYEISPSKNFSGNDGSWSTFVLQVGSPPATLFVLPATSGRSIWVVDYLACPPEARSASDACSADRGTLFNPSASTSWENISNSQDVAPFYQMDFGPEAALNPLLPWGLIYNTTAILGTDDISFGYDTVSDAPTLDAQFVATFASFPPYIGALGLSAFNESPLSLTEPYFSPLGAWKSSGKVAQAYYGYTAGAVYRDRYEVNSLGSLTFGGYDETRRDLDNVLTVPFLQTDTNRTLTVQVPNMILGDGTSSRSVDLGIPVLIDSLIPEIWLPSAGYLAIEEQFGLVWDNTASLYLVNDTQHADLSNRNVSITFSLAAAQGQQGSLNITLWYDALQPGVGWPLLDPTNQTATARYFPVRRADTVEQFYLGRTFLQEAYIAADYDKEEFYLSQAMFPGAGTESKLTAPGGSGGLSKGAIAGIVVGVVAIFAIAAGLVWWFRFKKNRKDKSSKDFKSTDTSTIGGTTLEIEAWNDEVRSEQMEQAEHYKPLLELNDTQVKPTVELDAASSHRRVNHAAHPSELSDTEIRDSVPQSPEPSTPVHRHELSAGTLRRASDQSRASVSPMDDRTRRRYTRESTFGVVSPQSGFSSPEGARQASPSPHLSDSQQTPPMRDTMSYFSGPVPWTYETHAVSRGSPATPGTPARQPEEHAPTADPDALHRLEGESSPT